MDSEAKQDESYDALIKKALNLSHQFEKLFKSFHQRNEVNFRESEDTIDALNRMASVIEWDLDQCGRLRRTADAALQAWRQVERAAKAQRQICHDVKMALQEKP